MTLSLAAFGNIIPAGLVSVIAAISVQFSNGLIPPRVVMNPMLSSGIPCRHTVSSIQTTALALHFLAHLCVFVMRMIASVNVYATHIGFCWLVSVLAHMLLCWLVCMLTHLSSHCV